jgi:hypothetical protein
MRCVGVAVVMAVAVTATADAAAAGKQRAAALAKRAASARTPPGYEFCGWKDLQSHRGVKERDDSLTGAFSSCSPTV